MAECDELALEEVVAVAGRRLGFGFSPSSDWSYSSASSSESSCLPARTSSMASAEDD